jgi:16S rRNA C967 or C1407 C5-methylase (RsmB/RsmF family)/NOL1/NOP2/fmu family ribosome biogenesis protein
MNVAFAGFSVMNGMKMGMNKQKPLVLCMRPNEINTLPEAFEARIHAQFGASAISFLQALSTEAPISVRLNPAYHSISTHLPDYEPVSWSTGGFYLPSRPIFGRDPLFHAGGYYVQEASSMAAGHFYSLLRKLLPQRGLLILDACAAPGGKSTHILSEMDSEDLLIANEYVKSRYPILTENLVKWGYPNQMITQSEPKQLLQAGLRFDLILADAPCSGEGLFRKDPESRTEWSEEQVHICALRQTSILESLVPMLNPGGILIYSTCTFSPEENEAQMQNLHALGMRCITPVSDAMSGWERVEPESHLLGWRSRPDYVKGEGFFITAFQNTSSAAAIEEVTETRNDSKSRKNKLPQVMEQRPFQLPANLRYQQDKDGMLRIEHTQAILIREKLESKHIPYRSGIRAGLYKSQKFIPDAEMAFWKQLPASSFQKIHVSHGDAMRYLRRDVLSEYSTPERSGIYLVCHQGMGLGWANLSGNRFNNLYPMQWRLRDASESPLIPFPEEQQ